MMMMPAARSKSRLSGIFTIEFAGSAIFSRAPLCPQEAPTRSLSLRSVTPAPTLSITPATSAAGENGNGGLIWYLPWIIRRSKKFNAADLIAITASPGPATGSGISVSTRSSGPQYCEQRMAFMDTPGFRTHSRGLRNFMPDLPLGYNTKRGNETMFEKGLLAGKRIVVTGGGSGLGGAMGRRFVELCAELIVCGRRLELLEATAGRMRGDLGGKVSVIRCDIRDGANVDAMLE